MCCHEKSEKKNSHNKMDEIGFLIPLSRTFATFQSEDFYLKKQQAHTRTFRTFPTNKIVHTIVFMQMCIEWMLFDVIFDHK